MQFRGIVLVHCALVFLEGLFCCLLFLNCGSHLFCSGGLFCYKHFSFLLMRVMQRFLAEFEHLKVKLDFKLIFYA